MKISLKYMILFLLIGQFQITEAQLFKRLQKRVENKIERKIEKTIDNQIDSIGKKETKKSKTTETSKDKAFNKQKSTSTTLEPSLYKFTFETKAKVTTSEDNRSYEMYYLLNPNENYIGLKVDMAAYSDDDVEGESIIVTDNGNSHIFIETQGMKMQISQNMMGAQQMQNPTDQMINYDYTKLNKTGNTKAILGTTCYEYVMSDDKVKMNLWVAPSINLPNWFIQNQDIVKGHIMAYSIESKDGKMTSETIAINENINKTINPKDYKKMF